MKKLNLKTKLSSVFALVISFLLSVNLMAIEYFNTSFENHLFSISKTNENTITINELETLIYCSGDTISVSYSISGTFEEENVFSVELSDTAGGFDNAIVIGSVISNEDGVILAIVPVSIEGGLAYKIRITSSNPDIIGDEYPDALEIINMPIALFTYQETGERFVILFDNRTQHAETYSWDFGGGNTSTLESPVFTYPFEGTYLVTLTASNHCGSSVFEGNVNVLPVICIDPDNIFDPENYNPNLEFDLFPNPVQNLLNLNFKNIQNKETSLSLYNTIGQLVFSRKLPIAGGKTLTIDLPELNKGIYLLHLQNDEGSVARSVVKN